MPIVAHNNNPSLQRISKEGMEVISIDRAKHQDIRVLHIGFLNMMPDAAFLATERQFFRLIGASTKIVQLYIHPIKLKGISRNTVITEHIKQYYESLEFIREQGLDALIVTGANPQKANIVDEKYWEYASELFDWAQQNVASIFFSCLSTHAILQSEYSIIRKPLPEKLWGVYKQQVINKYHPLVSSINDKFDMPHSRNNTVLEKDFLDKKLQILVSSKDSSVSLATSEDGIKKVFCQGHPEYDSLSLFKEYKREVQNFVNKIRKDYPGFPENYFDDEAKTILNNFKEKLLLGKSNIDDFPQKKIEQRISNTWRDTSKAIFGNWLGVVYQITNVDRRKQFMQGIDSKSPLKKIL